jgi:hypothetical protein
MLMGYSHVRYDHCSRPRVLHVVCPKCAGCTTATKASESDDSHLIGDLSGTWGLADWVAKCIRCDYRDQGLSYERLTDPYYRVEAAGVELWAWNRDHFAMLLRLLRGEDIKGDPYEWFATYAHRQWLKRSNRRRLASKMEAFLRMSEK